MYSVLETGAFQAWLAGLRDMSTRIRLARRLAKVARGNLGDVKLLGGGDKSGQQRDIKAAKAMAKEMQSWAL